MLLLLLTKSSQIAESLAGGEEPVPLRVSGESERKSAGSPNEPIEFVEVAPGSDSNEGVGEDEAIIYRQNTNHDEGGSILSEPKPKMLLDTKSL